MLIHSENSLAYLEDKDAFGSGAEGERGELVPQATKATGSWEKQWKEVSLKLGL